MSGSKARGETESVEGGITSLRTRLSRLGGAVRSQSETLGILVLVGVVLVLAAAIAVFLVADTGPEEEPRLANINIDATVDTITVEHEGGDTLRPEELQVIVITETGRSEVDLLDFQFQQPTDASDFTSGERFGRANGPYVGTVSVLLVHRPTETIIADEEFDLEPEIIVTVNSISPVNTGGVSPSAATDTDLSVGDDVNVTYTVENKDIPDDFTVTTLLDDTPVNETTVDLDSGESKRISVENDSVDLTDGLDVEIDAEHGLAFTPLSEPFFTGDFSYTLNNGNANVDYTVKNTGDIGATRTLKLDSSAASSNPAATETVEVLGGESTTGTFSPVPVNAGGEISLSTGDETESTSIGNGDFQVVGTNINIATPPDGGSDVWAGDNITVEYDIQNDAEVADTKTVELVVNGSVRNSTTHQVGIGNTVQGKLRTKVERSVAPFADVEIRTEDDDRSDGVGVYLPDPANFTVELRNVPEPANDEVFYLEEGDDLSVDFLINNTGEVNDTQTITLSTPFGTDTTQVSLDRGVGGGEEIVTKLTIPTGTGDKGEYTATVSSNNDSASVDAEIFSTFPDIIASLGDVEGSVGDTVDLNFDIITLDGTGDDIDGYNLDFVHNSSDLNITGVRGGDLSDPFITNPSYPGGASVSEFGASGTTPLEPGLILETKILSAGTSAVEFGDLTPNINEITDGNSDRYEILFENGTVTGTP